jgi:ferritin
MRFVRYVVQTGGHVDIPAIPAAKSRFARAEEAAKAALDHEVMVTKQINALVELAVRENDHITQNTLRWFVAEQLEEVHSAESLMRVVQRAGDDVVQVEDYLARRRDRREPAPAAEAEA